MPPLDRNDPFVGITLGCNAHTIKNVLANIKTEKMYHILNGKVKETLEDSYNFTKNFRRS